MSNLEVRKFDWDFEGIPFIWNPEQARFSVLMNQITFVIISFERYITKAMRAAESRITDPEVKTEARLFGQQEGVHASAHQKHARALIAQYPGLQSILDKAQASYDEQFESQSLEFCKDLADSGVGTRNGAVKRPQVFLVGIGVAQPRQTSVTVK